METQNTCDYVYEYISKGSVKSELGSLSSNGCMFICLWKVNFICNAVPEDHPGTYLIVNVNVLVGVWSQRPKAVHQVDRELWSLTVEWVGVYEEVWPVTGRGRGASLKLLCADSSNILANICCNYARYCHAFYAFWGWKQSFFICTEISC